MSSFSEGSGPMRDLRGKVAVVTGAASGIGQALARRFAREGMRVVAADVEVPALEATVAQIAASGGEAVGVPTDVSDPSAVEALARATLEAFGAVHIVCNNAGVEPRGFLEGLVSPRPMWEESLDEWRWVLDVNFWGVVHGIRSFVPLMVAQDERCHVVNTASVAGFVSRPGGGAYGASKHAVVRVTEGLHLQLTRAGSKVGVSLLAPGAVVTRIASGYRNQPASLMPEGGWDSGEMDRLDGLLRSHGGAHPDEVASMVVRAIRDGQFYIFTDDEATENIRARLEAIVERRNPSERRGRWP